MLVNGITQISSTESTEEGKCEEEKKRPSQKPAATKARWRRKAASTETAPQEDRRRGKREARLGAGVELEWGPVEGLLEDNVGILIVEKG
jgi:hypothetical protein